MIRMTVYVCFAAAILSLGAGPLLAGTAILPTKTPRDFSPVIQIAKACKPDGKACKSNEQCCSGNCQKGTDMPKGTCLHGD